MSTLALTLALLDASPEPVPAIPAATLGGLAGLVAGLGAVFTVIGYCLRELNKFRSSEYAREQKRRVEAEKERDEAIAERKALEAENKATIDQMKTDIQAVRDDLAQVRTELASQHEAHLEERRLQDIKHAEEIRHIEGEQHARREAQEMRHRGEREAWEAREIRLVGETHRLRMALAATPSGIPADLDPERPDVPMLYPDENVSTERKT